MLRVLLLLIFCVLAQTAAAQQLSETQLELFSLKALAQARKICGKVTREKGLAEFQSKKLFNAMRIQIARDLRSIRQDDLAGRSIDDLKDSVEFLILGQRLFRDESLPTKILNSFYRFD